MPGKIRFYLDEHVPRAIVQGLREQGVDTETVGEADLLSAPRCRTYVAARAEQRMIFTQDSNFLRLHATGQPHCGIVHAPQGASSSCKPTRFLLSLKAVFTLPHASDYQAPEPSI
jgi:predicted nuclease of predicted toxin-antitoxin system